MAMVDPFTDEQARALVNLEQRYQVWMEAERTLAALPYDLRRKDVAGRSYLYEIADRGGNGRSLGPWTAESVSRFNAYRERKAAAKERRDASSVTLEEAARIGRALRVPMLSSDAGAILREADRRGLLGSHLLVVGTNAIVAYYIEAGGVIRDAPDETQDFDMAWSATTADTDDQAVWKMLKAVDPTYTVNVERDFQARNARAYEFELLVAPSRAATMFRRDRPRPMALPEQEWLLPGRPVDRVVVCRDATPARIVAPDPRRFALHKLWLSRQAKRNPLKRGKDSKQGHALLDAIHVAMPQYPLDTAFEASLPRELAALHEEWKADRPESPRRA